jgi:hypothetical protein
MCIINGRRLRIKGDYQSLSSEEQAFLADQERCLTGFGWPGRDRDRRPTWRPRPPERFPALDGLLCSASATAIIRCRPSSAFCATSGPSNGWEVPVA